MTTTAIEGITTRDLRFKLEAGEGTDSVHKTEEYAYAVASLGSDGALVGNGLAPGDGNFVVRGSGWAPGRSG